MLLAIVIYKDNLKDWVKLYGLGFSNSKSVRQNSNFQMKENSNTNISNMIYNFTCVGFIKIPEIHQGSMKYYSVLYMMTAVQLTAQQQFISGDAIVVNLLNLCSS